MASKEDITAMRKQLKIKAGVVKRLNKEVTLYRKEEEAELRRVNKLKEVGAEDADIRSAQKVYEEAVKMVPDAQDRMAKSVNDLRDVVASAKVIPEFAEDQDFLKAVEALEEAEV